MMSLQQAIENIKNQEPVDIDWPADIFAEVVNIRCATAIATILNAVVKGELK